MPYYHKLGEVPHKRHTVFRRPTGELYHEELIGNQGFTGPSSLLYHLHPPTLIERVEPVETPPWEPAQDDTLRPRHFRTGEVDRGGNPVEDRTALLFNNDVALLVSRPTGPAPWLYRNGMADELVFVSRGGGLLESPFGRIPYRAGDYLVIPRGITHRLVPDASEQWYLIVESRGVLRSPRRYRTAEGQMVESAPYCERDFRLPADLQTRDESGEFEVRVKQRNRFFRYLYAAHPFDLVGWDGCYYPWAMNVEDFEPIVGRIHQPPPVHQIFEGDGFVVCNFVPRLFDFHPQAVPIPYNHSNAQSDEVIFYASERFMSRRGIEYGSITLHPDGIPHGPHPGAAEASLGQKETDELAVMVDTFRPLTISREAERCEDGGYSSSWLPR